MIPALGLLLGIVAGLYFDVEVPLAMNSRSANEARARMSISFTSFAFNSSSAAITSSGATVFSW